VEKGIAEVFQLGLVTVIQRGLCEVIFDEDGRGLPAPRGRGAGALLGAGRSGVELRYSDTEAVEAGGGLV